MSQEPSHDKHREDFERYAAEQGCGDFERNEFEGYRNSNTELRWKYWRAAQSALSHARLNTPNPAPDASEPQVPNGEYRELYLASAYGPDGRGVATGTTPSTTLLKEYLALFDTFKQTDESIRDDFQALCAFTHKLASAASATPRSVYEAAKKALRRYVWKAQNPAAPIAGTASLDGAMVELRDALLAAGEEQGFENNSSDGTTKAKS